MQSTHLRIAYALLCILAIVLPSRVLAYSDYGPSPDPVIPSVEAYDLQFITCPDPITTDCTNDPQLATLADFIAAGGEVQTGCTVLSFEFVERVLRRESGCRKTYSYIYRLISEDCNFNSTCSQSVTLIDTQPPVITSCPDNVTISAEDMCMVSPTLTDPVATDDCGDVTYSNDADPTYGPGTHIIVYTATDGCGNTATCSSQITVVETTPPTVTCPADITVECDDPILAYYTNATDFVAAGATITDNCTTDITDFSVSHDNDNIDGGSCPITVTRTYTITDEAGNSVNCSYKIIIVDTTDPTLTAPADVTINCNELADLSVTGQPTNVDDACAVDTLIYEDLPIDGSSPPMIQRIWIVSDECGNTATDSQIIEISDMEAPMAICQDVTVYLDENGNAQIDSTLLDNGSTDNCGIASFAMTETDGTPLEMVSCNSNAEIMAGVLVVTDFAGLQHTCSAMINIQDTIPPVLKDTTISYECEALVPPLTANLVMLLSRYVDGCPADESTFEIYDADTTDVCPKTIRQYYRMADTYANYDSAVFVVEIHDVTRPVLECPMDITVTPVDGCSEQVMLEPTFSDNCDDALVVITNSYNNQVGALDDVFFGGVYDIEFYAEDACGNRDTCEVTVTIDAEPKVTFPAAAPDDNTSLPSYASLVEFESAGGSINSSCNFDPSTFVYTAVYTKSDSCNGAITETVMITISGSTEVCTAERITPFKDEIDPVIDCTSGAIYLMEDAACNHTLDIQLPDMSDNIGIDTFFYDDTYTFAQGQLTTTTLWTVVDSCGNMASCDVDVIIEDFTSPVAKVDDLTVMCEEDAPTFADLEEFLAYTTGNAMVSDCHLDSNYFVMLPDVIDGNVIRRCYEVRDLATPPNTTKITHRITVDDSTPPSFDCTADITVATDPGVCVADITIDPLMNLDDNCNGATYTISNTFNATDNASGTYNLGTTPVIWTVTDNSGQTSQCSFSVTVIDTIPPVVSPDTLRVRVNCNIEAVDTLNTIDKLVAAGVTITENCTPSVTFDSVRISNNMRRLFRHYTITDDSGNETNFVQLIRRSDNAGPMFDSLPDSIPNIACYDALPPQEKLTARDGSGVLMPIVLDTLGLDGNSCEDREITYVWTATDSCGNSTTVDTSFFILADTLGPVADAFQDTVYVNTDPDRCNTLVADLTPPTFTDQCGVVDTVYIDPAYTRVRIGTRRRGHAIPWIAIDSCGNRTIFDQRVFVEDNQSPTVDCMPVGMGLSNATNTIPVTSFIAGDDDNCGVVTREVRRINANCEGSNTDFGDEIVVCCDDIGRVEVEVRVMDAAGNPSICTTYVEVFDKTPPMVAAPLADVTISCAYVWEDLGDFGTYTEEPGDVETNVINDPQLGDISIKDGLVTDNCEVVGIEETSTTALDSLCNTGVITRTFHIWDSNDTIEVTQTITIINDQPFDGSATGAIEWPDPYTWERCSTTPPDTSVSGAPVINADGLCSMIGVIYQDEVYEIANGGCAFIDRRWKVVDWCQTSDDDPDAGVWTYRQKIIVANKVAPTFDRVAVDTSFCTPNGECNGGVTLSIKAKDDCTPQRGLQYKYQIDTDGDGLGDINGTGSSFTESVPNGQHTVLWEVQDRCGNVATLRDTFSLKECKAPTAICVSGLAISLGDDGTVDLWASDIDNKSSDNCTSLDDLKYSFSSDSTDFGKTFTCADLGLNQVELWITDLEGNQTYCSTTVDIQDNYNACPNNASSTTVMGRVITPKGVSISDSKVRIEGAELDDHMMTDENGGYAFENIKAETDVAVSVYKEDAYNKGVNTLDLVMIQRHILGLTEFEEVHQYIAADANGDNKVNAADLLALRKVILGTSKKLVRKNAWTFVNKKSLDTAEGPWNTRATSNVAYGSYVRDGHFVGVKTGDVDQTISGYLDGSIESRSAQYLSLYTQDATLVEGEEVTIPIYVSKGIALEGIQYTLAYDSEVMDILSIESSVLTIDVDNVYDSNDGILSLAWNNMTNTEQAVSGQVFALKVRVLSSGKLSESLELNSVRTQATAYDNTYSPYKLSLEYIEDAGADITLHQNRPNPFYDETTVAIDLPEDMDVDLTIMDATGKVVWQQTQSYKAGHNVLVVNDALQGSKGVFYLRMEAAEYSNVIKMIKIN